MKNQKVIFITGASSGMGYDLAKELSKKGHIVYATARRLEKLQTLQQYGAIARKVDVTIMEDVTKVVEEILAVHGRIDVAYCNAGYALSGPIEEPSMEDIQRQFDINVFGIERVLKAVLPSMRKLNSGRIIMTESIGADLVTPYLGWYHATKFAVKAMATALREDLRKSGLKIDVVSIRPGAVDTEFADSTSQYAKTDYSGYTKYLNAINGMLGNFPKGFGVKSNLKNLLKAGLAKRPKKSYYTTVDSKILCFMNNLFGVEKIAKMLADQFVK